MRVAIYKHIFIYDNNTWECQTRCLLHSVVLVRLYNAKNIASRYIAVKFHTIFITLWQGLRYRIGQIRTNIRDPKYRPHGKTMVFFICSSTRNNCEIIVIHWIVGKDHRVITMRLVARNQLKTSIMTASNGNIFHVTGPLWGNLPVTGAFPSERPVTRSFDVFFYLRLNKRLSKQWRRRLLETPSRSLWRHCNESVALMGTRGQYFVNSEWWSNIGQDYQYD